MMRDETSSGFRHKLAGIAENPTFQRTIIVLIVVNAILLGLETSQTAMRAAGGIIIALDQIILGVFVIELAIRITAHGRAFFRDPWSIFDFIVVGVAIAPTTEHFSVLRALRVLRVLRLASTAPQMRRVVEALLSAVPGLSSVVAILCLIFYVAGVMATQLFGDAFPEWFGNIGKSVYSLFQIMTLESWSMGIVRPVMQVYPHAWGFFVPFILIATFTMLNLFIAVVVNAMQSKYHEVEAEHAEAAHAERASLLEEVQALRAELKTLIATTDRVQRQ
ncbi:MAG: ion transporter [Gammaproteobacteria bacterium]|nr:ion transporter [Gammaproteobacteria bacterium]NIM72882.1 ion transporter [Gammaproteobacteria bacterium]NIN38493.1 ion transporter [Gammaproteobacteria bacterium]NIO24634.1 ion transporter [Gammaproteobacteria bacterium]NIO65237.1 ion transporter [Gammaproteobacteria bacterium]